MNPTLVSIVIATYRRPEMVRDTVQSLARMRRRQSVAVEVIIIDNDPEGNARATIDELMTLCRDDFSLRYVHETRAGLSHARNRGIEESQGDIVAFLDDDLFVDEAWLVSMLDCFEGTGADCVGGRTLIHWEGDPEPIVRACESRLVALDYGDMDLKVRGARLPGGGNAAFRRRVFDRGLRFRAELGRVGDVLLSGEDTEMFLRLRREGGRIWYCAGGAVRHRLGGERLTAAYLARRSYWFGMSYAVIDQLHLGRLRQRCLALARLAKLVFVLAPKLAFAALRRNGPEALLARCSCWRQVGYLRGTLRPIGSLTRPRADARSSASMVVQRA